MSEKIRFRHIECSKMTDVEIQETSKLFSKNYGKWSTAHPEEEKRGKPISLSPKRIRQSFVEKPDRYVILAYEGDELVGHIFYLKRSVPNAKPIVFVLQLVVAENHRGHRIATRMLRSVWQISDCYAWGLFTSNPMTIKVLETTTMRTVSKELVHNRLNKIKEAVYDVFPSTDWIDDYEDGTVATDFYVDHQNLDDKIKQAYNNEKFAFNPDLPEGREWLAITFASQTPMFSSLEEWENYLQYTQQDIMTAYSNMKMGNHSWASHTKEEVDYLTKRYLSKDDYILDIGCGIGRHCIELNRRGYNAKGVDFSTTAIDQAKKGEFADCFECADVRSYKVGAKKADVALCLYDVVGSFPDEKDNIKILQSACRNLRSNGKLIISVMNMEITKKRCKNVVCNVKDNIARLLKLPPSNTMQQTGDVFDGKKILIDDLDGVVYRKEQFASEDTLPCEMIVRDRRYTMSGIQKLLNISGFIVDEAYYFRAGKLDRPLSSNRGKEIFIVAHKAPLLARNIMRFYSYPKAWKS